VNKTSKRKKLQSLITIESDSLIQFITKAHQNNPNYQALKDPNLKLSKQKDNKTDITATFYKKKKSHIPKSGNKKKTISILSINQQKNCIRSKSKTSKLRVQ
jgi:hypothetical protein